MFQGTQPELPRAVRSSGEESGLEMGSGTHSIGKVAEVPSKLKSQRVCTEYAEKKSNSRSSALADSELFIPSVCSPLSPSRLVGVRRVIHSVWDFNTNCREFCVSVYGCFKF